MHCCWNYITSVKVWWCRHCISGSKGALQMHATFLGPIYLIFMHFSTKILPNNRFLPQTHGSATSLFQLRMNEPHCSCIDLIHNKKQRLLFQISKRTIFFCSFPRLCSVAERGVNLFSGITFADTEPPSWKEHGARQPNRKWQRQPPPNLVDRVTDTSKNITLPKTSFVAGKNCTQRGLSFGPRPLPIRHWCYIRHNSQ